MNDQVYCRSDNKYAERPVALVWEGEKLEIEEVYASWRTPDGISFRVQTVNKQTFNLHYNESKDNWQIDQP